MTDPQKNHDRLADDLLAQARAQAAEPGDDLIARVLADAAAYQPQPDQTAAASGREAVLGARPGLWAQMMEVIGGWPALGSLGTATVAGIWIGVAPPAAVLDLTAALVGDEVSVAMYTDGLGFDDGGLGDG